MSAINVSVGMRHGIFFDDGEGLALKTPHFVLEDAYVLLICHADLLKLSDEENVFQDCRFSLFLFLFHTFCRIRSLLTYDRVYPGRRASLGAQQEPGYVHLDDGFRS